MTGKLWLDFETWSSVNITKGTDVYMNGAKPTLCTFALDDEEVQAWDCTVEPMPEILLHWFFDQELTLVAHNAFFDRMVIERLLGIQTRMERWHCTYAQALAHGLPGGLGPLGYVLGIAEDQAKIADGYRLIKKFCGPKPLVKDEEWDLFIQYAINDTSAMRECYRKMPNWNYKGEELRLYHVDQIINNRGFAIDRDLARAAMEGLAAEKERLAHLTEELTHGEVESATKRDKFLRYICEQQGCFLPDLRASTIDAALEDESIDESTKVLLRIRREASKSSGSKFKRLDDSAGTDDRLRGTLQYSGANRTARWAGRIFQPQNLPRPNMEAKSDKAKVEFIRVCTNAIKDRCFEIITLFASINVACSNALRGLIVAADNHWLLINDWKAIEGRVNAWLSGETWKVKAFRDGSDLYKIIYALAFGIAVDIVTKAQRQVGKVMELALGYGGGVGAFINMAAVYGLDLDELGRIVPTVAPADVMAGAQKAWDRAVEDNMTYGLTQEAYMACDALKIGYRRANPEIVRSWYLYEDAARTVINEADPNKKVCVGRLVFDCDGKWMRIKLPSGRYLVYALPRVSNSGQITYMSWRNKKWSRTKTYGGKLCENIVQAVSRDILGHSLLKLHDVGYPVVLHVHDEIVSEVPLNSHQTLEGMSYIMTTNPPWAPGLPLEVDGFEGARYEKH